MAAPATSLRTRLVFGPGCSSGVGSLASEMGFRRTLLVADRGIVAAGHVARIGASIEREGIAVFPFHDFEPDPTSDMVARGCAEAAARGVDSIISLGGGSSLDCGKGINFLLTNGGSIEDYRGYGKAERPMLPMIGIPTTAGTGSEAQSYAIISDPATHAKMACGDPKAAFRVAMLDPELAASQPERVRATAGCDAISHALETSVTTARNPLSACFTREAWRLLDANFERVLTRPDDIEAMGAMMLGAHFAGLAIENSMLGAAHACANPLSARYGTTHGLAVALMLKHVVLWNGVERYEELCGRHIDARLDRLAVLTGLPRTLREIGAPRADLPQLAEDAAQQWTGQFNPRPLDAAGALELYKCAY